MRIRVLLAAVLLAGCSAPEARPSGWRLVVLGVAQDGGMPHLGCTKPPCSEVRDGRRKAEKVSCLGLVNDELGAAYLFDATPDLPAQVHVLTGGRAPDGIFVTHAHIGHYTGLMYLGKETMAAKGVPVYATPRLADYLKTSGPWSLLVQDKHIDVRALAPDGAVELPGGIRVRAFAVPHRDEFSDTVGYVIEGPRRKAIYVPDIDKWEKWDRDIRALADSVDVVFLDGTFESLEELPHRDITKVRHPLMSETRERMKGSAARLLFIHLNHSNPALRRGGDDVAREGMEIAL
jgi:pyrroloquinoline quinone biosynthesis protein B